MFVSVTIDGALCDPTVVPASETAAGTDSWPGCTVTALPVPDNAMLNWFFVENAYPRRVRTSSATWKKNGSRCPTTGCPMAS